MYQTLLYSLFLLSLPYSFPFPLLTFGPRNLPTCNNSPFLFLVSSAPPTLSLASTPPAMPGTHPPNVLVGGGRQREYPCQYYYVLLDIAYQYWLPSVRSASSRFHSAIRRHQFATVRQADSRLTRLVPPTLNSR